MKNITRVLAVILCALLLAGAMAACSNSPAPSSSQPQSSSQSQSQSSTSSSGPDLPDEVYIAWIGPLTGNQAQYGETQNRLRVGIKRRLFYRKIRFGDVFGKVRQVIASDPPYSVCVCGRTRRGRGLRVLSFRFHERTRRQVKRIFRRFYRSYAPTEIQKPGRNRAEL